MAAGQSFVVINDEEPVILAKVVRPLSDRTFLVERVLDGALVVFKTALKSDAAATVALYREFRAYEMLKHLQGVVIPQANHYGIFGAFRIGEDIPTACWVLEIQYCQPGPNFVNDDVFKTRLINGILAIHAAGYMYGREFDDAHIVAYGDRPLLVGLANVCSHGHMCTQIPWNGPDGQPLPTQWCCEMAMIVNVVYYEPAPGILA